MPADVIDLADARIRRGDHMVRGTAADGMVRAIAVTQTRLRTREPRRVPRADARPHRIHVPHGKAVLLEVRDRSQLARIVHRHGAVGENP